MRLSRSSSQQGSHPQRTSSVPREVERHLMGISQKSTDIAKGASGVDDARAQAKRVRARVKTFLPLDHPILDYFYLCRLLWFARFALAVLQSTSLYLTCTMTRDRTASRVQ